MMMISTTLANTNPKSDKYNVKGCQRSFSHPSWSPIVTNTYDITNNGEDETEKQNTEIIMRKPVAYTVHSVSATHNIITPTRNCC